MRSLSLLGWIGVLFFASVVFVQAGPIPMLAGDVIALDKKLDAFSVVSVQPKFIARTTVVNPQGELFRLFFSGAVQPVEVKIRIISADGLLQEIPSSVFEVAGEYGSNLLTGDTITVEVEAATREALGSFSLRALHYDTPGGTELSITNSDERVAVETLVEDDAKRVLSKAVAKITFRGASGRSYLCTGFLVDATLLLTNEHCIDTAEECQTALVIFGYVNTTSQVEQARCTDVVVKDPDIDVSLLRLDRAAGDRWGVFRLGDRAPATGEKIWIPQHPGGRPLEISDIGCLIVANPAEGISGATDFANSCDTEEGASGAPVVEQRTATVIGIHHWGFEFGSDYAAANRGVRVEEILRVVGPYLHR